MHPLEVGVLSAHLADLDASAPSHRGVRVVPTVSVDQLKRAQFFTKILKKTKDLAISLGGDVKRETKALPDPILVLGKAMLFPGKSLTRSIAAQQKYGYHSLYKKDFDGELKNLYDTAMDEG